MEKKSKDFPVLDDTYKADSFVFFPSGADMPSSDWYTKNAVCEFAPLVSRNVLGGRL